MVLSDAQEVAVMRVQTAGFIASDPITVNLQRRTKVANGSGGFTWSAPSFVTAQDFKLIPQSRQLDERPTLEGRVVRPQHVLLGLWNADIQEGDYFVWQGNRYDIVFVHEKRDYETVAEVEFRGAV